MHPWLLPLKRSPPAAFCYAARHKNGSGKTAPNRGGHFGGVDRERAAFGGAVSDEHVTGIEKQVIGEATGFLSSMAIVRIKYDRPTDAAPAGVVVKLMPVAETFRETEHETHAFAREVAFYRDVAPSIEVRVPRVYYAVADEAGKALVFEDLSHLRAGNQVAGMQHDEVLATVRQIARVHASFWESDRLAALDWLPDHDQMWRRGYEEHWPAFEREFAVRLGGEAIALGERVLQELGMDEANASPSGRARWSTSICGPTICCLASRRRRMRS